MAIGGVAVELEGGEFVRGRHQRPIGFANDCEKYSLAAEGGWLVLRFPASRMKADPEACVRQVRRTLRLARGLKQG